MGCSEPPGKSLLSRASHQGLSRLWLQSMARPGIARSHLALCGLRQWIQGSRGRRAGAGGSRRSWAGSAGCGIWGVCVSGEWCRVCGGLPARGLGPGQVGGAQLVLLTHTLAAPMGPATAFGPHLNGPHLQQDSWAQPSQQLGAVAYSPLLEHT